MLNSDQNLNISYVPNMNADSIELPCPYVPHDKKNEGSAYVVGKKTDLGQPK